MIPLNQKDTALNSAQKRGGTVKRQPLALFKALALFKQGEQFRIDPILWHRAQAMEYYGHAISVQFRTIQYEGLERRIIRWCCIGKVNWQEFPVVAVVRANQAGFPILKTAADRFTF